MNTTISLSFKGEVAYSDCFGDMQQTALDIANNGRHKLWVVSHPPVYTLGQASKPEHLLRVDASEQVQSDRGGQVTWHGPGQIVFYPLLRLRDFDLGPKKLVQLLEKTTIATLADYAIAANTRDKAPGVYVNDAKIASLGLRIKKGVSYHGLSLNFSCDLQPFTRINPCGYPGLRVTRVVDQLPAQTQATIKECTEKWITLFTSSLGTTIRNL